MLACVRIAMAIAIAGSAAKRVRERAAAKQRVLSLLPGRGAEKRLLQQRPASLRNAKEEATNQALCVCGTGVLWVGAVGGCCVL